MSDHFLIAQFDWRADEIIKSDKGPINNFFYLHENLFHVIDEATGQIDAQKYAEFCQISPRYCEEDFKFRYDKKLAVYVVKKDLAYANAIAENNIMLGNGGVSQIWVKMERTKLIKEGYLELVEIVSLVNRDPKIDIFSKLEEDLKEVNPGKPLQIRSHIGEAIYDASQIKISEMRESDEKAIRERVDEMEGLNEKTKEAGGLEAFLNQTVKGMPEKVVISAMANEGESSTSHLKPVIDYLLSKGNSIQHVLAEPYIYSFNGADCVMDERVDWVDLMEQFEFPDSIIISEKDNLLRDTRNIINIYGAD